MTREYTCEQWALMDGVPPTGWEVVSNTCQVYLQDFYAPFAAFTPEFTADAIVPNVGRWYIWEGVISSDRLVIPLSELRLPSDPAQVKVEVRRQGYRPSEPGKPRDFWVNNVDNSIDFIVGTGKPSLNTFLGSVWVWKA